MVATAPTLTPLKGNTQLRGFGNLFSAQMGGFWKTRKWWVQALIWTVVINGILALTMWTEGQTPNPDLLGESLELITIFVGIFGTIGMIANMQSAVISEKREGQAEWIMSKPVSRVAYILSKLIANLINLTLIIVVLQAVVAFTQISAATGVALNPVNLALGTGALILHGWWYLTLTLMLGAFFNSRLPVLGIPLGIMMLQQFLFGLVPELIHIIPATLALPFAGSATATELIMGLPVSMPSTLYTAPAISLLFVAIAVWRFSREEF